MTKGSDSISASTRTFQTNPSKEPSKPKKALPKPDASKLTFRVRLPWLLVGILIIFSLFMVQQYHAAKHKLDGTSTNTTRQANDTISKVQKLAAVPTNETPTVAPISDVNKLKGQSFFERAKNGDIVLVYGKAKEAVLYRPSTNQIVTISNVTVNAQ